MADDEVGIRIRIKEAAKAIGEITAVKNAVAAIRKEADANRKSFNDFGNASVGVLKNIGSTAVSGAQSLARYSALAGAAATAATGFGLKTASSLEQSNLSFKFLLGSQEKATELTEKLQTLAKESPFQFTDFTGQAQRLLALKMPIDQVTETLRAASNASAAFNLGGEGIERIVYAFTQINRLGHLAGTEVRQLSEAGIDAVGIISEATGKTTAKIQEDISNGLVPGPQAVQAITKWINQNYGGIAAAQQKTLVGQINTLQDTLKSRLYKVGPDGKVGGALGPLVELLERNLPAASVLANKAIDKLTVGVQKFVFYWSYLARGWKTNGMTGVAQNLGGILGIGDRLVPVWKRIKDTSADVATIWRTSLWPSIQGVIRLLEPFVVGALKALEATLHWMAEHPGAASAIFYGLAAAIAGGAILMGIKNVIGALLNLRKFILETRTMLIELQLLSVTGSAAGAAGAAAAGGAAAGSAAKKGGILGGLAGLGKKGLKFGARVGAPAVIGWEAGSWIADNANPFGSDNVIKQDGSHYTETVDGIVRHAGGGTQSLSGWSSINENGQEAVWLPGGSKVMNNKDLMKAVRGGGGPTITFAENSIVVSGTDVLNADRVTDILVQKINDRIARQ